MNKFARYIVYTFLALIYSCTNEPPTEDPEGPIETIGEPENEDYYFLINDAGKNKVYLMDKGEKNIFEWELESGIGNDCYLMKNGQLLAILQADDPKIDFGGFGGKIQIINSDFSVDWEYIISDENKIAHHDIEMLPNGNILVLVWIKKTALQAKEAGFQENYPIYTESIWEINPENNEIVWKWNSWDHLIQDFDSTKNNFGDISSRPHKIDLNYSLVSNGDIMHANGLDYDPENDLIYVSVNFFSEVWVIDHSTSTSQAAGESGGNYGKGGDLVYRFGNPEAYKNSVGTRLFYHNHYPNLIKKNGETRMLLFMNGYETQKSTVFEFDLSELPPLKPNANNEPPILWRYTHPELFSSKVSGAELLSNDNILITIGTYGIWEVNRNKDVLWKYESDGFYWRTYPYLKESEAINNLNFQ